MWREALTDQKNDLYEAAWLLFTPGVSVETATERLKDKKDAVVELLKNVLDEDELYDEESYGDGNAPVKAIYLLGEWNVAAALPTLLEVLEVSETNDKVREAVIVSLRNMGADIIDHVIAWGNDNPEFSLEAADVLSSIGQGNEAAFAYISAWVEKEDDDLEYYIDRLIELDPDTAERFLDNFSTEDKENRKLFRSKAREAKKKARERAEQRLKAARQAEASPESSEPEEAKDTEPAETDEKE
ncbi:MAG: hypothetical protein L0154_31205 [Chloroflexi bacterium]|nr:hypothetical protein [Chloroflexota bacterium]